MGEERFYPLKYPITVTLTQGGGSREEVIDKLTFRRLTVADLRATSGIKNEEERGLQLLRRSTGLSETEFDKIDIADLSEAQDQIEDFLPKSPQTGGSSLPPSA